MLQIRNSDTSKNEISTKYLEDAKQFQSICATELTEMCNRTTIQTEQVVNRFVTQNQQNCALVKVCMHLFLFLHSLQQNIFIQDSLKVLETVFDESQSIRHERLATIGRDAVKAEELSRNLDHQKLAKEVEMELMNMDKENACLYNFKSKWSKVEPSGDTPKKQNYDYNKDLLHFHTPGGIRNLRDDSLLDVSVGPLDISAAPPEEVEHLEDILEQGVNSYYLHLQLLLLTPVVVSEHLSK